MLFFIFLKS